MKIKGLIKPALFIIFGLLIISPLLQSQADYNSIFPSTATFTPTQTSTIMATSTVTNTPTSAFSPTFTLTSTITLTPTITLPSAVGASCVPPENERVEAKVVGITDGDTITVEIEGQEYKLRYIGVDTPETGAPGGSQAIEYNRSLVDGKTVILVKDTSEVDRYDRLLRYVFVDDIFVNYEMIRAGYAESGTWPPDTSCDNTLNQALQAAKANQVGLWVPTSTPKPVVIVPKAATVAPPASNCDPSYPTVCIPPYPPDLDCGQISFKRFKVVPPDPHGFDRDGDGIGCES